MTSDDRPATDLSALLARRFSAAHGLYADLAAQLSADQLRARLPGTRSAPVGNGFWCVVGARESYAAWARAGAWQGFASSLTAPDDPDAVRAALERSAAEVLAWLASIEAGDERSWEIALHLLEHEAQHHGQLIRYLYGVPLPIPRSWIEHYALDEP